MTFRMLIAEAGVLLVFAGGSAAGVAWERGRRDGTRQLRWQRDRLFHENRRLHAATADGRRLHLVPTGDSA